MARRNGFRQTDDRGLVGQFSWLAIALSLATIAYICIEALTLSVSASAWSRGEAVKELPVFAAAKAIVESSDHVELWRGLPRYTTPSNGVTYVERSFGVFESVPIEPGAEDARWLRDMCTRAEQFSLLDEGDYKACGGYHADWSVVFAGAQGSAEFGLCFGCGEVKILATGAGTAHLDLRSDFLWMNQLHPYSAK